MDFTLILSQYWRPALFSFLLAFSLVKLALKYFPRLGLMDRPHLYGHKRQAIPYYGGLAIFLSFMAMSLYFVPMSESLAGLLIGATIVFAVGFLDDLLKLSPWIRLLMQFVAAFVLVIYGIGIFSINLPFLGVISFAEPVWQGFLISSAVFTILWVMTILNTMNFVDGVSGLNSGVTFVAAMTIFFLSVNPVLHENPQSQVAVATLAIILAAIALAFNLFDFPRAKILMGDSGSTLFGFLVAVLAIFSGGKVATAFLVLGIPILDMIWVVLRRVYEKKKFWQGDLKHLHHRLLDIGFSDRKVVSLYLGITVVLGAAAVLSASGESKLFMIIALLVLMLVLASALVLVPSKKK
jgi:UDP-GlcNAc:undecaprenyl-phosphate/decaprenyl-phosphate GlcNAc-1-phosphate transferase